MVCRRLLRGERSEKSDAFKRWDFWSWLLTKAQIGTNAIDNCLKSITQVLERKTPLFEWSRLPFLKIYRHDSYWFFQGSDYICSKVRSTPLARQSIVCSWNHDKLSWNCVTYGIPILCFQEPMSDGAQWRTCQCFEHNFCFVCLLIENCMDLQMQFNINLYYDFIPLFFFSLRYVIFFVWNIYNA